MPNVQSKSPLFLIFLAGFALRLFRLGTDSLWYDETVSAILARNPIPDLIAHTARDIHPPGYYILLRGWTQLVGETEFSLAFLSLIFGVLIIAGSYHLASRWFNRQVGLFAAILIAFSPYNLWYSQEVRMYTLGAFLGIGCLYFGAQTLTDSAAKKTKQIWAWVGYTITATLGLYCLYYFAFLLIPQNLFIIGYLITDLARRKDLAWQDIWKASKGWIYANLSIIVLYTPWLGNAWKQATDPPVPPWRSHIPLPEILLEGWTALSFGESIQTNQIWPLLIVTFLLFCLGVFSVKQVAWRVFLLSLCFGPLLIIYLIPLLGVSNGPLYHVRYLYTYSPIFYITIALGLVWIQSKTRVLTLITILCLLGGATLSIHQLHTNPKYAPDDLRQAVQFIQQKWRPGDIIILNAGYSYTAFTYYYTDPIRELRRLSGFDTTNSNIQDWHPQVLQTGTVDGSASLGWGDPRSDFYALSREDTIASLEQVRHAYPRLWMLRIYDTVTDPDAVIRQWLSEKMQLFEDRQFSGPANMRVQGYMSTQPFLPQQTQLFYLEDKLILHGITPPASTYRPGEMIDIVLWWEAQEALPNTPYALSLKLWDDTGALAAQSTIDEWPVGNHYLTPDWQPGQIIRFPMRLQIPSHVPPNQYWLNVIVYDSETGKPLHTIQTNEPNILLGGTMVRE